jgi:O-methyltransferase involved in polyketide biosynthesis
MSRRSSEKIAAELDAVPETLLWTLYHRAVEARRPDTVLDDPLAVELVGRIDFPFEERFGPGAGLSQWQALRARCFDDAVRSFLAAGPGGTVVALGEGLETQFWRVDDGSVRWLTVDLPEVVALQERLLPASDRRRAVGSSVLDGRWPDEVDASSGVLLTAQGLLMYLQPGEARGVIETCATRFPGGRLVFDTVPRWLAERTRRSPLTTPGGYRPPAWSWGLDRREEHRLRDLPRVRDLRALRLPRGRGVLHGGLLPVASRLPFVRRAFLTVLLASFAPAAAREAR